MGALRTSEEGGQLVGGEAKPIRSDDDARKIDAPGQIIIDSAPAVTTSPAVAPARPVPPPRPSSRPVAPARAGGLGVVVIVYIVAAAALAAAIYERYFMT